MKEERSETLMQLAWMLSVVVIGAIIYFVGYNNGKDKERIEHTEKVDSLQPYDRVFMTNNHPRYFHRDPNCTYIQKCKVIAGLTMLMAESEGMVPCEKCTVPHGIVHHISYEEYKEKFESVNYSEEEEQEEESDE